MKSKKTDQLVIQSYLPQDYPQIAQNLKDSDMFHLPWDSEKNVNRKCKKDPQSIIVATVENKITGSIFVMEDSWGAFLYRLAVKKEFRKKGVGTKLLSAAEDLLKKRGVEMVDLWVDFEDKKLVDYYSKRGYYPIVKRLLMSKTIK